MGYKATGYHVPVAPICADMTSLADIERIERELAKDAKLEERYLENARKSLQHTEKSEVKAHKVGG